MPHASTEDQLVEQPAIGLFAELGWTTVSALERDELVYALDGLTPEEIRLVEGAQSGGNAG